MVDDWFKRYLNRASATSASSSSSSNHSTANAKTNSKPNTAQLNPLASKPKASMQTTARKVPSKSEVPSIEKPVSLNTKNVAPVRASSKKETVPKSISLSKNFGGATKQTTVNNQPFARKPQIPSLANTKPQKTNTLTNSKASNKIDLQPKTNVAANKEKQKVVFASKAEENKENISEHDKIAKSETSKQTSKVLEAQQTANVHNTKTQPKTAEAQNSQLQQNKDQQQVSNGSSFTPEDFVFGKILGKGQFGHVYIARHITTKFVVALKVIGKVQIAKYNAENNIQREIEIQSHLKHPNIIKLYSFFQDAKRYFLLLEYAPNGELYKLMQKVEKFDEKTSANYMIQLTSAIAYCHKFNIIHRDLKLENILIGKNNDLKIADFGWSVHSPSSRRRTMCGTLDYLAPEITENKPHDANVDIWCLGILCYEFVVGRAPFAGKDTTETYELIRRVRYTCPDHVSTLAKEFIAKLLVYVPSNRLPLNKFPEQSWIKEHIENPKLV